MPDAPPPLCAVCGDEDVSPWWPTHLGRACSDRLFAAYEDAAVYLRSQYPSLGTRVTNQLAHLLPTDWAALEHDQGATAGPWLVMKVQKLTDQRLLKLSMFGPTSLARVREVLPYLPVELDRVPTHADVGLMQDLSVALASLQVIAHGDGAWDPKETAADALSAITLQQAVRRLQTTTTPIPEEVTS